MAHNKIKIFREQRKLTVEKVAERSGLSKAYISLLENGIRCNPSQKTMEKIADAIGKTVQAVFFPKD